jgi:hypothetical protein
MNDVFITGQKTAEENRKLIELEFEIFPVVERDTEN